jgi:hypothetical protein
VTAGGVVEAAHRGLSTFYLHAEGEPALLFCDNDTNAQRLYGFNGARGHFKDAIPRYVVAGDAAAVNPAQTGTKCAAHYAHTIPAGGTVRLRLAAALLADPFGAFDSTLVRRRREADEFYAELQAGIDDPDGAASSAAGAGGHGLGQAVLSLQRVAVAAGRPGAAAPPTPTPPRPQQRLGAPRQR